MKPVGPDLVEMWLAVGLGVGLGLLLAEGVDRLVKLLGAWRRV